MKRRPTAVAVPAAFARALRAAASRSIVVAALSVALGLPCLAPAPAAAQEPVTLEDLIVTVHRRPVPLRAISSHVSVLDGEALEAAGYTSLVDALRGVPGLAVVQSGSFGATASVFLRGGESDYVKVLIDGVEVNEPGGRYDFANLPVEQIERIEIVRGPGSAMYGSDAVGGVIQILTRTGSGAPALRGSVMGGTYDSWRGSAQLEGGGDRVAYGFSVSGMRSDGSLPYNNDYDNLRFSGRVDLSPDSETDVRVAAHYADHTFHFPTDGAGALVDENSLTFGDETTVALSVDRRLSHALALGAAFRVHDSETGSDDLPDGPADTLGFFAFHSLDDLRRASGELSGVLGLGVVGEASAGVELETQSLRSLNESDSEFGPDAGSSEESRWNRAYRLQWLGEWAGLAANGSVRLEDNETFGDLVSYTAGLAYTIDASGTKLRANLGRGIKEPTLFENFATGFARGNPDLDPERSFSWEVGVDQWLLARAVRVSATYFDQDFEDLIQFTFAPPDPGDPNYFNVASARSRGLELETAASWHGLQASVGYTYLHTEAVDAGFDEGPDAEFVAGERLLRRPTHELAARLGGRLADRAAGGVSLRWVGDRVDRDFGRVPAARVELPAYTVVDLDASLDVLEGGRGPGLTLLGRVENLFDEVYEEVSGFPARGRTVLVGGVVRIGGR